MEASDPAQPATVPVNPKEVLQTMLTGLGLNATVEQSDSPGAVSLRITTDDPARLIGRHGQTLSQLQFLTNRILLRLSPDAPRVTIDCEGYRERLRDDIVTKVQEVADNVRRWGEPQQIGPFGGSDRRVIHQHFSRDPEIEAVSEGDEGEGMKKMTIRVKQPPKD